MNDNVINYLGNIIYTQYIEPIRRENEMLKEEINKIKLSMQTNTLSLRDENIMSKVVERIILMMLSEKDENGTTLVQRWLLQPINRDKILVTAKDHIKDALQELVQSILEDESFDEYLGKIFQPVVKERATRSIGNFIE